MFQINPFLVDVFWRRKIGALARKELMRSSWVVVSTLGRLPENISSHRRCSIQKFVLKNFAKFTGKHPCQSLYFNKACNFIKKGVFLWILQKFLKQLLYRASPGYCFWRNIKQKNWTCFRLRWKLITLRKKMKFSIKDFFRKYEQICSFLRIWSHLLKKSL